MATTIKRILPTRVLGNLGNHETYCDLDDAVGYLNFRNGETLSVAPTRGIPSSKYYNKNIRILLNEGQLTPDSIPKKMRTMFGKNAALREAVNGGTPESQAKPFNQYTKDECYSYASYIYNAKNGFGIISGEAGENEGPWKFQSQYAGQQMKWVYEGITKFANDNPSYGILNFGLNYASCSTIWPGKQAGSITANYQTIKDGLSSPQAARNLLAAFEWEFNRHWGGGYYETGTVPVINGYTVHNDCWLMYWKTIMQMELVAKANEGLPAYSDPRTMLLFMWARAIELQPYTEQYLFDLGNNVLLNSAEWPTPNPNMVMAMAGYGFEQGKHVIGWDNPYIYGTDPNILPDAGDRISYPNGTGGRQVVSKYQAAPYQAGVTYPYSTAPFGYNDLIAVAGKMHCRRCDFINKRPAAVQWTFSGASGPAPDAGYIPYCIDNHSPHIRAAVDGNRAVIRAYHPDGNGGTASVNLGGSFGTVTFDLWPNADNQFHLQA